MDPNILFCPIYDKNLKDMISAKNEAKNEKEKLSIMKNFAKKFTLLPPQRIEFITLHHFCNQNIVLDNCLYSVSYGDKNAKHIEWSNKQQILNALMDHTSTNRFQLADEVSTFPHKYLQELCEKRMYFSVNPMSKVVLKEYYRSMTIYNDIKKYENDIVMWLAVIKSLKNKEVIMANMELKLGQNSNWKNKKLWKFYFKFLKENNAKEILDVFRRYTRLFICDKQAVKQYRNEINKYSMLNEPTTKFWIDTIKYEITFGKLEKAYRILEKAIKAVTGTEYHYYIYDKNDLYNKINIMGAKMAETENSWNCLKMPNAQIEVKEKTQKPDVYYQNPKLQYLCFRRSFVQNLLKNSNGVLLRKLLSTCKFFYWLKQAPLCYRLEICGDKKTSYCQESLYLNQKDIEFDGLKNLHVYFMLEIRNCLSRNLIPKILPKLKKYSVKNIFLSHQDLTASEFKSLLSHSLITIYLYDVVIKENGSHMDAKTFLEEIKNKCSNILHFEFVNAKHFICSTRKMKHINRWFFEIQRYQHETVYIENQTLKISDLQKFIDYQMLKNITLKNVIIKDVNKIEMKKDQIEEIIKADVNPMNQVCIEIL